MCEPNIELPQPLGRGSILTNIISQIKFLEAVASVASMVVTHWDILDSHHDTLCIELIIRIQWRLQKQQHY